MSVMDVENAKMISLDYNQGFLRCFRDPIRVPRIENRVPRISENDHRVPRIRENRVPKNQYRVPNIFFKKTCYNRC